MGILDNIKSIPKEEEPKEEPKVEEVVATTLVDTPSQPVEPAKQTGPRELLRINGLDLTLKGFDILKNVNASIIDRVTPGETRGQIIGILGPSGVGKTKLFECISGLRTPEDTGTENKSNHVGEVLILDRDDTEAPLVPVNPGRVGVVMQQYPLFEWRTVQGNLMVAQEGKSPFKKKTFLEVLKNPVAYVKEIIATQEWKKKRVTDILAKFQMLDKAGMYPCNLSGGQRQRVAIAQQLLSSGHFLLMDEPFSGLDVLMIKEVLSVIKQVADMHEYNTIIVVSHDIVSTASIADTLWIMGRDRDNDKKPIPGARVKQVIDMVELGLAYKPGVKSIPAFRDLCVDIEEKIFPTL